MKKNEFDLAELLLHIEALKIHSERDLPSDVKEKLEREMTFVNSKIKELENGI